MDGLSELATKYIYKPNLDTKDAAFNYISTQFYKILVHKLENSMIDG